MACSASTSSADIAERRQHMAASGKRRAWACGGSTQFEPKGTTQNQTTQLEMRTPATQEWVLYACHFISQGTAHRTSASGGKAPESMLRRRSSSIRRQGAGVNAEVPQLLSAHGARRRAAGAWR